MSYVILLSGCSLKADFIFINKSGKTLTVKYELHESENIPFISPKLAVSTIEQLEKYNTYDSLPPDRFTADPEKKVYSVVLNDQEVLFLTKIDIYDISKEPVFKSGISKLSVQSETGSVSYSGDQVFQQFVSTGGALLVREPTLYTLTYK